MAIADTCAAFAPSFLIYCLLRFLTGMSATTVMGNIVMLSKPTLWILGIFQGLDFGLETESLYEVKILLFVFSFSYRVDIAPVPSPGNDMCEFR